MKKLFLNVAFVISLLFFLWLIISFAEVTAKSLSNPVYSDYNAFVVFLNLKN